MEFRDLKTQYSIHKEQIDRAILSVVEDAHFIGGSQVGELEKMLADYVGVRNCITCANGTDALELALMAWNIGPGDAVFVPDFTFFSTGEVVASVGATPVFVDINIESFNMDASRLETAIEYVLNNTVLRPKAVIPVDLFGLPADFDAIKMVAKQYDMLILEDAAQGFGGSNNGTYACGFGDIATTSFFPAKPLGCYGDGGAIFTNNDDWAAILRSYKVHGKGTDKYDNIRVGMNSRLDTIQAAILIEKLKFFKEEVDKCNKVARKYNKLLENIEGIKIPIIADGYISSWAQYTILVESSVVRDRVINILKENGIPAMIYYKKPMHLQEAFGGLTVGMGKYGVEAVLPEELSCKNTEDICNRCISLPMSAYVDDESIEIVASLVREVV